MTVGMTEIIQIPQSEEGREYAEKIVNLYSDAGKWVHREDTPIYIELTVKYALEKGAIECRG